MLTLAYKCLTNNMCLLGQSRNWKTFDCMQSEQLGLGDKPDYFMVKAVAAFIKKENCMYMVCANDFKTAVDYMKLMFNEIVFIY